jgi:hypothetical protein
VSSRIFENPNILWIFAAQVEPEGRASWLLVLGLRLELARGVRQFHELRYRLRIHNGSERLVDYM